MQTETRKLLVDDAMRRARASEIGKALNETHRWHSHSRGLSIEVFLDVKKVVAANPGIDERKLQEGMEMLRKLRELGFKGAVYNIESPFARRRTKLSDSAKKAMRKTKSRR